MYIYMYMYMYNYINIYIINKYMYLSTLVIATRFSKKRTCPQRSKFRSDFPCMESR